MRLSAKDIDGNKYYAWVNGCRINYAAAADTDEGWVDFIVTGDYITKDGDVWSRPLYDYDKGEFLVVRVYGFVELLEPDQRSEYLDHGLAGEFGFAGEL